ATPGKGKDAVEGERDGAGGRRGDRRAAHGGTAERGPPSAPRRPDAESAFAPPGVSEHRLEANDPKRVEELRFGGGKDHPGAGVLLRELDAAGRIAGHPGRRQVRVD